MKTVQTKREREKRMVTEMIKLYCKSSITQKAEHYVLSVMSWTNTQNCAVISVRLWRQKHFVPTAKCIVISR